MTKTLSDAAKRARLMDSPHILAISPRDSHFKMPEIGLDLWAPEYRGFQKQVLEALETILTGHYITDDFETNTERRTWRKDLESKYSWFKDFYDANGLSERSVNILLNFPDIFSLGYIGPQSYDVKSLMEGGWSSNGSVQDLSRPNTDLVSLILVVWNSGKVEHKGGNDSHVLNGIQYAGLSNEDKELYVTRAKQAVCNVLNRLSSFY